MSANDIQIRESHLQSLSITKLFFSLQPNIGPFVVEKFLKILKILKGKVRSKNHKNDL